MFTLHDLHWIAATLNPRTRMLKFATDTERAHAHGLVHSELVKVMDIDRANDNQSIQSLPAASSSPSPHKKFKSYTAKFYDDIDCPESNKRITNSVRARRELQMYLQVKLINCTYSNDENDNPLLFWKEQQNVLPNLSQLAKKIFSIPASSAAVERAFSSAGVIISQRRSNTNPSMVNDIILVRSAATYLKDHI
jgi:hypothetical protein